MSSQRQNATTTNRLPGLDMLRCLAAGLIFTQHTLSSCHEDNAIDVAGFRVGRIGTAIFFLLGGYLCARSSRKPAQWLKDRLISLLPAYWIITAVGFGIAAALRNKPFDAWQVICQFAGVGYVTHGDRLINVATWFITPLLFFYGVAAILRLMNSRMANLSVVAVFTGLAVTADSGYTTVLCHGATFFAAFSLCQVSESSKRSAIIPMLSFGVLCAVQPEFRYAFAASLLLLPALHVTRGAKFATRFTSIAYEWFLVHGIVVTGGAKLFTNPVLVMLVSIPTSIAFAWMLKQTTAVIVKRVSQFWQTPLPDGADPRRLSSGIHTESGFNPGRRPVASANCSVPLSGPKSAKNKSRRQEPAGV